MYNATVEFISGAMNGELTMDEDIERIKAKLAEDG